MKTKEIAILGGALTGLTLTYFLKRFLLQSVSLVLDIP